MHEYQPSFGSKRHAHALRQAGIHIDQAAWFDNQVKAPIGALPRFVIAFRAGVRQMGLAKSGMKKSDVFNIKLAKCLMGGIDHVVNALQRGTGILGAGLLLHLGDAKHFNLLVESDFSAFFQPP